MFVLLFTCFVGGPVLDCLRVARESVLHVMCAVKHLRFIYLPHRAQSLYVTRIFVSWINALCCLRSYGLHDLADLLRLTCLNNALFYFTC